MVRVATKAPKAFNTHVVFIVRCCSVDIKCSYYNYRTCLVLLSTKCIIKTTLLFFFYIF